MKCVDQVLMIQKISKSNIDEVVLVGGTTRIPKMQQMLSDYFGGKQLCSSINPDEAVAYGATVQASLLAEKKSEKLQDFAIARCSSLVIGT